MFSLFDFPGNFEKHMEVYILPVNVPTNQFMNLEGNKISTSRNWAVWVHEYLLNYLGKQDELRYVLIKNMPEQKTASLHGKATKMPSIMNWSITANFVNRVMY